VILAGCNELKGREAVGRIRPQAPGALVRFERLELGSLAAVDAFAGRLAGAERPIDLLVNAAGVRALPVRQVTEDGFEKQLGINYLGHFALTARLLPLLCRSRHRRVVQLSSLWRRRGVIEFDDIQLERSYNPGKAYWQSKLAALLFSIELQRKSDAHGWGLRSIAAHPGHARAEAAAFGPGRAGFLFKMRRAGGFLLGSSADHGALPALFAATAPDAIPGAYYGPPGAFEQGGWPSLAAIEERTLDEVTAHLLWTLSERLTRVTWTVGRETGPGK
jgi:NAD(P)-dependent dehydrogenase (short-subunit alcohol dehydrogenase family)